MKVLLTGGCGFVGSHVADALLDRELSVRILDRRPEQFRPPLPGVEYVFGDFGDPATLAEALAGCDAVVHLASTTVPGTADRDPIADIEGNLIATLRLLQAIRASPVRKMIYLSSGGTVYGIPEIDPAPETHHPYDLARVLLDITPARQSFGWAPEIELDEGLSQTWEWVRAHAGSQVRLQ